jgi:hypothetical protein
MSRTTLILSALMTIAFILMMAPNVIAMNKGKVLRNIAAWLAIIVALGLIYNNFGPESKNPIIPASPVLKDMGNPKIGGHNIEGTTAPASSVPSDNNTNEKK